MSHSVDLESFLLTDGARERENGMAGQKEQNPSAIILSVLNFNPGT